MTGPRLARRRFDLEKLNTDEGRAIVAAACENFPHPAWQVHSDEHCRQIEQHLLKTLQNHFPLSDRQGCASYIPGAVWEMRQRKCMLRWRTRARKGLLRTFLQDAFRQWKQRERADLGARISKQLLLYEVVAAAVEVTTHNIRQLIADAKDKFLRSLAKKGPQDVAAMASGPRPRSLAAGNSPS